MVKNSLLIFLFLATSLMANIGKIVALKGDVTIVRDNTQVIGTLGSVILKEDELLTKDNAKAQLLFNDNTVITIGKNSIFKVKEYLYDDINKEYATNFELLKGTFRTITGKIGKVAPDKFKLNSRTSSIGIRGTQILSRMAVVGDRIVCIEGEILVTHLKTGKSIVIKAGEFVDLNLDTQTLKAQKLQFEDIKNMDENTRFTLEDDKNVNLEELGVTVSEPENVAWGEWNTEAEDTSASFAGPNAKGIGSETTPEIIVNSKHTATYKGKIDATHYQYDAAGGTWVDKGKYVDNSTNEFQMTVNFGTRDITNGVIKGETSGGSSVNITNITGTVKADGSGFDLGNGDWNANPTTGSGSGSFYGTNGEIVKGTYSYKDQYGDQKSEGNFNGTSQ